MQGKEGNVAQSPLLNQCVLCVDLETMASESGATPYAVGAFAAFSSAITGKALEWSWQLLQQLHLSGCCLCSALQLSFDSVRSWTSSSRPMQKQ